MPYFAAGNIKHNGTRYFRGDLLPELSKEQAATLLSAGAVEEKAETAAEEPTAQPQEEKPAQEPASTVEKQTETPTAEKQKAAPKRTTKNRS